MEESIFVKGGSGARLLLVILSGARRAESKDLEEILRVAQNDV